MSVCKAQPRIPRGSCSEVAAVKGCDCVELCPFIHSGEGGGGLFVSKDSPAPVLSLACSLTPLSVDSCRVCVGRQVQFSVED